MAVIHTLLKDKLYNATFAEKWIADLDELSRMASVFTPEVAEAETGIKAADIEALARPAAAPKVVWHPGWRTPATSIRSSYAARLHHQRLLGAGAKGGCRWPRGPRTWPEG
jgi:thiosulfate reductase/polysulfide reductase chain A